MMQKWTTDRDPLGVRERFLAGDSDVSSDVDSIILGSWRRSQSNSVSPDHPEIPYLDDWDDESLLVRAAKPVLDDLERRLAGEPISVILTDQSGVILDRRVGGSRLRDRLDDVSLAPGFSYSEEFVGTNGIGTALESGDLSLVSGGEHYAGSLITFSCAGVPLRDPIRGVVLGVLDLTSFSRYAPDTMLTALATSSAQHISEELLARRSRREAALFEAFTRAHQRPGTIVMAIGSGAVMMTESMRLLFGPDEQQDLVKNATGMFEGGPRATQAVVELSSGRRVQMRCRPVEDDGGSAGAVYSVRLLRQSPAPTAGERARETTPRHLPGLAGVSPPWRRCVDQVRTQYSADEWFVLAGEAGTGKTSLVRAVHYSANPYGSTRVVSSPDPRDVDTWSQEVARLLATPDALVVLSRAETLPTVAMTRLSEMLRQGRSDPTLRPHRLAATVIDTGAWQQSPLSPMFPALIEVPPLRYRLDDLPSLAARMLAEVVRGDPPSLSDSAVAQLSRLDWPGNIAELRELLLQLVRLHPSGVIDVADLPPRARASSHRRLTPIEALERDAIVQALLDNSQRASAAAEELGMSRATIYRKLRRYGISLPIPR